MHIAGQKVKDPLLPIKEVKIKKMVRTSKEASYTQIRSRSTRTRRKWTLEWKNEGCLTEVDFQKLMDIQDDYWGSVLEWTHPFTNETYTNVFIADEELSSEVVIPSHVSGEAIACGGYRSLTLHLEQI